MERAKKVGLRVGVMLGLIGAISFAGCSGDSIKDTTSYDAKVKIEATADDFYITSEADFGLNSLDKATGEATYSINLNQIGYRPNDRKIAAVSNNNGVDTYHVLDGSGNTVYSGKLTERSWDYVTESLVQYANFSMFTEPGSYYLICGDELYSDEFIIGDDVYREYYDAIGKYFSDFEEKANLLGEDNYSDQFTAIVYDTDKEIDVTDGWYNLRERGQYTVDSCTTIASLFLLYDTYYKLDLQEEEQQALKPEVLLHLIKKELGWLKKLQNAQGGVYHKVTVEDDENQDGELYVYPVSTCATADFAAIMAKAYRYYEKSDWEFANSCLAAAQNAWLFLENNQSNMVFINPENVTTSEYTDEDDGDERFWAAVELSLTTKRSDYVGYVMNTIDTGFNVEFTWQKVAGYAIYDAIAYGKEVFSTDTYNCMQSLMETKVNSIKNHVNKDAYQVTFDSSVTFQTIISEAITLYLMAQQDMQLDLSNGANAFLDYLMGTNSYSENYVGESMQISNLDMDYIAKIGLLLVGVNESNHNN